MQIHFRPIEHTPDEISMGQQYWHYPVAGCDAVSATANTAGFTPLLSIDRHFGWNREVIKTASDRCNNRMEVCVVELTPTLLLVPATKGQGNTHFLVDDLFKAAKAAKITGMHFTHYGFIQGRIPAEEAFSVLNYIFSNSTALGLNRIVIDIDARIESEFYALLSSKRRA